MAGVSESGLMNGSNNKALDTLNRLTPIQKIALGAAVMTLLAGAVLFSRSGNTAMAAVYTDLEPRDAAAVTEELNSRGVSYELTDGGRTVMVPREDVYDLRIGLSAEGLPGSNEGYALLDEQGITTSEFRQRIDFQRALEGELAMSLRSIDGIDSATVHLALPDDSVFIDEPSQPTAAVLVQTSGTADISNEQVAAMVHLVAYSVKGMEEENVTIADGSGAVLSVSGDSGGGGSSGDARSDATNAFEQEMSTSLRNLVGRVAGFENVAVRVAAELDLTQQEATTETFDSSNADAGVVVAEATAAETYSGSDAGAVGGAGVLGPDGAPVAAPAAGDSTYSKDNAERTYAVNRTVESTTAAPGSVTKMSVAVLVNEEAVTEAQRLTIEAMVGTAAGVDLARGDQVVVTRLPFDETATAAALAAAEEQAATTASAERNSMIRTGIILFVIVIAMLLAYRSTRRARREVATPIDIGAIRSAEVETPQLPPRPHPAPAQISPATEASREALEELSTLTDRRPEEVAQILQSWLSEEAASK